MVGVPAIVDLSASQNWLTSSTRPAALRARNAGGATHDESWRAGHVHRAPTPIGGGRATSRARRERRAPHLSSCRSMVSASSPLVTSTSSSARVLSNRNGKRTESVSRSAGGFHRDVHPAAGRGVASAVVPPGRGRRDDGQGHSARLRRRPPGDGRIRAGRHRRSGAAARPPRGPRASSRPGS